MACGGQHYSIDHLLRYPFPLVPQRDFCATDDDVRADCPSWIAAAAAAPVGDVVAHGPALGLAAHHY